MKTFIGFNKISTTDQRLFMEKNVNQNGLWEQETKVFQW